MKLRAATTVMLIAAMALVGVPQSAGAAPVTVSYQASDANIANPDRGFVGAAHSHYYADGSGFVPLSEQKLTNWRENDKMSTVRVFYYMDKFASQDTIDQAYLDLLTADFATARSAGVRLIVRFAYTTNSSSLPVGDAPKSRVISQIDQLGPVLRANSDVIALVEAGFIGAWGEEGRSDYFGLSWYPDNWTAQNWADRAEVYQELLDELPDDRMIASRTPLYKQKFIGTSTGAAAAIPESMAYDGSDRARIGFHNDCFLADATDTGTYQSATVAEDKAYLAAETQYLPMTGETCSPGSRGDWATASAELAEFHWSHLTYNWWTPVYNGWGEHLAEVQKRLGYRFTLTEGTFPTSVAAGTAYGIELKIRNDGYATPYNPRNVQLVLQSSTDTYTVDVPSDPRRWAPGTVTTVSIADCAHMRPGTYHLYLNLPDPDATLSSQALRPGTTEAFNSAYAIQLANVGTWQADTGYNDLGQTLTVTATGSPSPTAPVLPRCHS